MTESHRWGLKPPTNPKALGVMLRLRWEIMAFDHFSVKRTNPGKMHPKMRWS
jgi:hypothetical protein